MISYYKLLGVKEDSSKDEIKTAFKNLSKSYHPDLLGTEKDEFFKLLNDAYAVLNDDEKRAEYDNSFGINRLKFDESDLKVLTYVANQIYNVMIAKSFDVNYTDYVSLVKDEILKEIGALRNKVSLKQSAKVKTDLVLTCFDVTNESFESSLDELFNLINEVSTKSISIKAEEDRLDFLNKCVELLNNLSFKKRKVY
jgi:DnaJ-class molecular chaperone